MSSVKKASKSTGATRRKQLLVTFKTLVTMKVVVEPGLTVAGANELHKQYVSKIHDYLKANMFSCMEELTVRRFL